MKKAASLPPFSSDSATEPNLRGHVVGNVNQVFCSLMPTPSVVASVSMFPTAAAVKVARHDADSRCGGNPEGQPGATLTGLATNPTGFRLYPSKYTCKRDLCPDRRPCNSG